ncbi:MAG: tRNA guanosine(34) transglycosylase Tgt, partial [Nanoarchaeota archaeon]|nr:tRNA guanosine(34) transglycosylase Tgt [Nanoarchaeota archaeon]
MNKLSTLHGQITLPSFFPDGTRGVVKTIDSIDLENAQVEGLVINTYHLLIAGLEEKIERIGGVHVLMDWKRPVITDSGGFQVMSLIHKDKSLGKMTDEGATFKLPGFPKIILTPEKSIQMQIKLGADILICLDDCTKPDQKLSEQEKSVERTIAWALRCKLEFDKLTKLSKKKPLLFAVVQGGNNKKLRKKCAENLIKIGFDGYCFGGFPVDKNGKFLKSIMAYVASLLPDDKIKYA